MPRAKKTPKREVLRQHLADCLGVPVSDILTRAEVVEKWGSEIGYTNEKSLSNAGSLAPCFYLAPLFGDDQVDAGKGLALYNRHDLWLWVHDRDARRAMENEKVRPRSWPLQPAAGVIPLGPSKSASEEMLDDLTDDRDYKEMVLARQPYS